MSGKRIDFNAELSKKLERLARNICSGSCNSFENYKYKCGQFNAYKDSLEVRAKADKAYLEDEEVDNLKEEKP
jgi:hypothetical protein